MDSSARQAMLGEQEKPKTIDNVALDPDWLTARYKMEKRDMWWDTNQKARYDRNFCGTIVNVFYFFILLTELVLWIKVKSFSDVLYRIIAPYLGSKVTMMEYKS